MDVVEASRTFHIHQATCLNASRHQMNPSGHQTIETAGAKLRKTFNDGGMGLYPNEEETPGAARALPKRKSSFG